MDPPPLRNLSYEVSSFEIPRSAAPFRRHPPPNLPGRSLGRAFVPLTAAVAKACDDASCVTLYSRAAYACDTPLFPTPPAFPFLPDPAPVLPNEGP